MNNIFKISILQLILLLGLSCNVFAQNEHGRQIIGKKFFEAQLIEIKNHLNLSEQTEVKVEAILRNYYMELESARNMQFHGKRIKLDSLTDATAEMMILDQINSGKKYLQIREKYYYELKKIVSPIDIYEIFKIEQDVNRRLMMEYTKRKSENINH
ncbi:MAG: hypothetical protein PHX13_12635 [Thiovulaceae bacterium]|nr:hypothetical protein [Sulfurimonadaceae bacterium]